MPLINQRGHACDLPQNRDVLVARIRLQTGINPGDDLGSNPSLNVPVHRLERLVRTLHPTSYPMIPDAAAGLPMYPTDPLVPPVGVSRIEARWTETSTDTGNVNTFCTAEGIGWMVHGEGKVSVYWGGEHRGYRKSGRSKCEEHHQPTSVFTRWTARRGCHRRSPGLLPHEAPWRAPIPMRGKCMTSSRRR